MTDPRRFTIIITEQQHPAVQRIADFRGPEAAGMFPVLLTRLSDGLPCRSTPQAGAIDDAETYGAFGDSKALRADLQLHNEEPIPLTVEQIDDAFEGAVVLDYPMSYKAIDDAEYFASLGYRFDGVDTDQPPA